MANLTVTPPKELTVLVDQREKKPLKLPTVLKWCPPSGKPIWIKIAKESTKLLTADYVLKGYEDVAGVERKGDWMEIYGNLCGAKSVQGRDQLRRLGRDFVAGVVFLDFRWWEPPKRVDIRGEVDKVYDELIRCTAEHGVGILHGHQGIGEGTCTRSGTQVVRWLWNQVWVHSYQTKDLLSKVAA